MDTSPQSHADAVAAWARAAAELVEQEDVRRPVIIAIDGPACAGKSTLAALTSAILDDAPVVAMDDLYPGWDGLAEGVQVVVDKVLGPASRGERAWFVRYDWPSKAHAETVIVPDHYYLVVEGVGASTGAASQYADVRIWVDAPEDVRRQRGESRTEDGFDGHWQRWADQEAIVFGERAARDHAHLRIGTGSAPRP